MKKFTFMLMAVAAFLLASCKKENGQNGKGQDPVEEPNTVTWGGVTYKTVELKDGRTWMAEPLRYLPNGKTASEDPKDDSGLWYPYKSDGKTCTPLKDEASVKALGYLYDIGTALGAKLTEANFKTFEGKQGICPDGWHIPTRAEFIALCGSSVKGADDAAAITDDKAAYYNSDYSGAKVVDLDKDGFNWTFSGSLGRNTNVATGAYQKVITSAANCSVKDYFGKNSLTILMGSTGDCVGKDKDNNITNYRFFGLMSTFTSAKFPEGRLSVAFANYKAGYQIRCIKDLKK